MVKLFKNIKWKHLLAVLSVILLAFIMIFSVACGGNDQSGDTDEGDDSGSISGDDNDNKEDDDKKEGGTVSIVSKINIDTSDEPLVLPYTLNGGDGPVSWSSDYASVAAVDKTGKLYPVAPGTATITASTSTHTKKFTVNVTDIYRSYIRISTVGQFENLAKTKDYTRTTKKYCLGNDIDFGGATIKPLGVWGDSKSAFNCTFDGRGYALKNRVTK